MTRLQAKEAGMVMVYVDRRTLQRIVNCLRLAAKRVQPIDPEIAGLFERDADSLEQQALSY